MKKLFTVVLLGTMVSLAACESKKAETTSTDSTSMAPMADSSSMMATDSSMMATDSMATDSTK